MLLCDYSRHYSYAQSIFLASLVHKTMLRIEVVSFVVGEESMSNIPEAPPEISKEIVEAATGMQPRRINVEVACYACQSPQRNDSPCITRYLH